MSAYEVNFDGLVGLTHHYAGLSFGNVASTRNQQAVANPKLAARQGLLKMKQLADLGFVQAVLPPHERPQVDLLRQLGFSGTDAQVLARAAQQAPRLLCAVSSASAMWTANAATVSPSSDTADGRVHFTVANLNNKFHRASEAIAEGEACVERMLPLIENYPPPATKGKYIKIKYVTQLPTPTPQFAFFVNLPQYIKEPYRRFLENNIRDHWDFAGVPMQICFRQK